jgi:hypothetical protein
MLGRIVGSDVVVCAALAFGGALWSPAAAAAQGVQCATNPFVGNWQLDRAKSKPYRALSPRDLPSMGVIAPSGQNGVVSVFIGVGDFAMPKILRAQFDDKPVPLRGAYPRLVQMTRVDCNTIEIVTLRQVSFNADGTVKAYLPMPQVQTRARLAVSADGKTLTQTRSGESDENEPIKDEIMVYDRV